jgi:hypothetical protein
MSSLHLPGAHHHDPFRRLSTPGAPQTIDTPMYREHLCSLRDTPGSDESNYLVSSQAEELVGIWRR